MKLLPLVFFLLFSPFVAAAAPLKLAFPENYAPMIWTENGQMKGVIIDVLNKILRNKLNIETRYDGYPWSRAQVKVKKGLSDAFVTIPIPERLEYTTCSTEPVFSGDIIIYTYVNHPQRDAILNIKSAQDLMKFVLVDYRGNGWIKSKLPDARVVWTDTLEQTYKLLANKRADIIVRDTVNFDFFARDHQYTKHIEKTSVVVDTINIHLCINKNSKYISILPNFDKAIQDLRNEGTIDAIIDSYTKPSVPTN
ncbi:ABC transporter substrate-binding protein [Kiloniella sp. EL199]|uniref:substrate-binding periplasmic protein n=1 Tax=Kiloniella sp. EL199 TaxID=2107581 RepID=UPI000EA1FE80|nr:transporter substrate-binding domain-containing protein [Kiloniella sp. EL199]